MPVIPTVTTRVNATSQGNVTARANAEAFGASVGRAVEAAGDTVQFKIEESLKREGETLAAQRSAEFEREELEAFNQAKIEAQENPDGFTDKYLKGFESRFKAKYAGVTNNKYFDEARERSFRQAQSHFTNNSINYESSQKLTVQRQRLEKSASDLSYVAYNQPERFDEIAEKIRGNLDAAQSVAVIPNAIAEEGRQLANLAQSTYEGFIERNDYSGARDFLDTNGQLLGEKISRFEDDYKANKEAFDNVVNATKRIESYAKGEQSYGSYDQAKEDIGNFYKSSRENIWNAIDSGDASSLQSFTQTISNSGVVPKDLVKDINLRIGLPATSDENIAQTIKAVELVSNLSSTSDVSRSLFKGVHSDTINFVEAKQKAGYTANEIAPLLRDFKSGDIVKVAKRNELSDRFKSTFSHDDINGLVEEILGDNITEVARDRASFDLRTTLQTEFFRSNGDVDVAKHVAQNRLRSNYRKSSVSLNNGVTRLAPENLAPESFNNRYSDYEWARGNLYDYLDSVGIDTSSSDREFFVSPYKDTEAKMQEYKALYSTNGSADPSIVPYKVFYEEDGKVLPVLDADENHLIARFNPFSKEKDFIERRKKELDKATGRSAKIRREDRRKKIDERRAREIKEARDRFESQDRKWWQGAGADGFKLLMRGEKL